MKLRGINFAEILDWYLGITAWGITTTTFLIRNIIKQSDPNNVTLNPRKEENG